MFTYLNEWIQNIAFYLVLITALLHILPDSSYQKYVRFFTGLVLILLILAPVLKLFGMEDQFQTLYDGGAYQRKLEEIQESTAYLQEIEVSGYLESAVEEGEKEAGDGAEQEAGDGAKQEEPSGETQGEQADTQVEVEEIRIGR